MGQLGARVVEDHCVVEDTGSSNGLLHNDSRDRVRDHLLPSQRLAESVVLTDLGLPGSSADYYWFVGYAGSS